jgi:hypothetical protein
MIFDKFDAPGIFKSQHSRVKNGQHEILQILVFL